MIRKIAQSVYIEEDENSISISPLPYLMHECEEGEWMHTLYLRENEEGPLYWCEGCGATIENGEAMAIRLYEANY